MAGGTTRVRRPRTAHQRIARILAGLVLIGAGLVVFRYASEIANQFGAFISPPPEGDNNTVSVFSQGGYLPFVVWGSGFTLIGIGATMIRSAFMASMLGSMGSPAAGGGGDMSPEMLNAYMQQAVSSIPRTRGSAGPPESAREFVKIKCRTCGSLEAEDASYCRKCGNPL